MLTKTWRCPRCGDEFIVAVASDRDDCPWCNTPVQEKDGALVPAQRASATRPDASKPAGEPQGGASSSGRSGAQRAGDQQLNDVWWPYEYDPF